MANSFYKKEGKIYLKCKECLKYKELGEDNRYKHSEGFLGVLGRCRECIKKGRRTEEERMKARINDKKRYYEENGKRKKRLNKWIKEYTKRDYVKERVKEAHKRREKEMGYGKIHLRTQKLINKLGIRPSICPICNKEKRIIAHHPDYTKRFEVVFCCDECHKKIHYGKINEYKIINLIKIN